MRFTDRLRMIFGAWPNVSLDEFAEQMRRSAEGDTTRSGAVMGPQSAMQVSAFFNGVGLITASVASCKCILYERLGEGAKQRFTDHTLYGILRKKTSPQVTAYTWVRVSVAHVILWGNAFSIGTRDLYRGNVTRLDILHPSQVKVFLRAGTGELEYVVTFPDKHVETLTRNGPRFIFHVPGFGFNGITGFSLLSLARESLGLTSAMEQFGQLYFGNGINPGGFVEHPQKLSPEAHKRLRASIEEQGSGLARSHGLMILEEGMKFNKNTIPLEDAQFLLSRTFQIQEIARWLNITPHKLKELSRSTFSNIEHLQIEYIQDTIQPYCELFESEINVQLIQEDLQDRLFAEFLLESLLRGDTASRNTARATQRQWGIINADEWRAGENMNPLPDGQGQVYIVPSNYTISEKLGQDPPAPPPPPPQPVDQDAVSEEEEAAASAMAELGKRSDALATDIGRLTARIDGVAMREPTISVAPPNVDVHLTLEHSGKVTRKIVTMHHAEGGETTAEIVETPEGKD